VPLPGTRIFEEAVRERTLFTLDRDRFDLPTPVITGRVHPALVELLQLWMNYSIYLRNFLRQRIRTRKVRGWVRSATWSSMPVGSSER